MTLRPARLAAVLSLLAILRFGSAAAADSPNIVLIYADDLRAETGTEQKRGRNLLLILAASPFPIRGRVGMTLGGHPRFFRYQRVGDPFRLRDLEGRLNSAFLELF